MEAEIKWKFHKHPDFFICFLDSRDFGSPMRNPSQIHYRLSKFRTKQLLSNKTAESPIKTPVKYNLGVFFSILGKALGYVHKTRNRLKHHNIANLSLLQLRLINDKAFPEACYEKKRKNVDKSASPYYFSFLFEMIHSISK